MAEREALQSYHEDPRLELRYLLDNFRKSLKLWFLAGWPKSSEIADSCVEILMHGIVHLDGMHCDSEERLIALHKFMDEIELVRKSALIKDLDFVKETKMQNEITNKTSIKQFLHSWVLKNLKEKTFCASIETLIIIEKALLEANYHKNAFLRTESYAHAFIIGLSAFELNQYSLISKIDKSLYTNTLTLSSIGDDITDGINQTKQKRTNSLLSLPRGGGPSSSAQMDVVDTPNKINVHKSEFYVLRKTKSLPTISKTTTTASSQPSPRPRSKTLVTIKRRSLPKSIPPASQKTVSIAPKNHLPSSSSSNSSDSQLSISTISSNNRTNSSISSSISPNLLSSSSNLTSTPQRRIELIKCDDIKIWTDQSQTPPQPPPPPLQQQQRNTYKEQTLATPMAIKKPKSISPMNSFLSSLFATPPTYSKWYIGGDEQQQQSEGEASAPVASSSHHAMESHCTISVFDSFIPVYGKKVQSKRKSNLFEDGISTLDYKPTHVAMETPEKLGPKSETVDELHRTPTSSQSLTAFLQMAQLSRNNTDLEKENAHFRISEAIISAIEHIKWAKSQPKTSENGADLATDWLENERKNNEKSAENNEEQRQETFVADSEYIPFVEHSESCLESLSAEVVGLSLISRFNNDKHMPKVSELKWLVSDDDTPQQLLPMPSSNGTSLNPDEHIFPPMTRGTKYWAPPRPQIIFTDHPTPNRKALIRKQNNRCAGCGMCVSTQNMSSFRYCTYLGKYHCTGCHRNQMSATPAKILQMWDFKCYPVSVFAYRLIEQMYTYPLFHVPDLNPALYVKSKLLLDARNKRLKLKFIKDFIKACRFAKREQSYFENIPDYITNDIDTWSMSDFVEAQNESMQRSICELIEKCENHIFHCVLCTGRGFCCEYCLRDHVIYPWENKVFRCDRCGSCFHLSCWKAMLDVCCRCQRIWNRQNEVTELMSDK